MRRFLSVLLAISLSWVTTGYACRMDGLRAVRAVCCCPHRHEAPKAAEASSKTTLDAGDKTPCCKVVARSALDDQQPGLLAQSPALDLSHFAAAPVMAWSVSEPAARTIATLPPARGPPFGSGTRTYFTTARLRL